MKKKIPAKNRPKPRVRKKVPKPTRRQTWVACGFDTSMSSLAGAAVGYDFTLRNFIGPVFHMTRWNEEHYFDRLKVCAKGYEAVLDLIGQLKMTPESDEIFIAVEEPFPFGMAKSMNASFIKQQSEISGAFMGGLLRYGYTQLWQISNIDWRQIVARDLSEASGEEITIHHSKWRSPALTQFYNCKPTDSGKFRAKQWALDLEDHNWTKMVPDWPDIINSKHGKIPRPEGSKAKAVQPDDRYDSLAVMQWMVEELERGLT